MIKDKSVIVVILAIIVIWTMEYCHIQNIEEIKEEHKEEIQSLIEDQEEQEDYISENEEIKQEAELRRLKYQVNINADRANTEAMKARIEAARVRLPKNNVISPPSYEEMQKGIKNFNREMDIIQRSY